MGESESSPQPPMRPIFYDESQRRWLWLRGIMLPLAALFSLAVTLAVIGIGFLGPLLLPYQLKRPAFMADVDPLDVQKPDRRIAKAAFAYKQDRRAVLAERRRDRESRMLLRREESLPGTAPLSVSAGFYVNWDESSYISLSSHIGDLTHLIPEWLHLAQPKGPGSPSFVDENAGADGMRAEAKVVRLCREHHVPIVPLLNNYLDGWHVAWLSQMLRSPQARTKLVDDLESYLVRKGFQGINIDLENVPESDRDHLSEFVEELASRLRARRLLVTQDVPVDDPAFDLPRLGAANNFLIAMLYDEHASDTDAGPIASQSWYHQQLATLFSQVPHDKVVLGLGNYAYDWMKGGSQAHVMTYQDAVVTASESEGVIRYDPVTRNPHYDYYDDSDKSHEVWLLDATTAYNQVELARPQRPAGAALWYVGSEDPSLWSFFGREHLPSRQKPDTMRSVRYGSAVDFEGEGEYLSVVRTETDGHRTLSTDSKGLVVDEKYDVFPSGIVIRRRGGGHKLIALTFDDGPDPRWTPQILDILKQNRVNATFFIVGSVADQNPGLVKRIWREGNELGNHTFTHGNMARMSTARVAVELSATQRLIQSLTGHSSRLFRAPYVADAEPQTPEEVEPILQAQRLGYVTLGETNDPEDWLPGQSADRIVSSVVSNRDVGNVILLHDAGGDRSQTVLALPRIIRTLKSQGYRFVTASQLLPGAWNQLFPPLSGRDTVLVGAAAVAFEAQFLLHVVLVGLFWVSVVLGTLRVLITAVLAVIQARRESRATFPEGFLPSVSVLIAAYNEAKVIRTTVEALLRSDYPNLEVIVVDDGSKDGTARIVEEAFAQEPRLRVLRQENGGKASALNRAIAAASGEVFVMMDADTLFAADTVSKLVRHFADPRVGAVAGNAKVGNPVNLLTRWQSVEYITSQNFDRRAYDVMNGIPVVPGAVGAWRREAVMRAGGYLGDTLAEDTELTFRVRMLGYRIRTESHAYAYTEAPTSLGNLARQRYRWAFGTLQTLWKHRGALLQRKYGAFGMVTLPALWVYQILLQAASPIVDLAVAMALLSINFKALLFYYAAFFVVELVGAALAFRLDRENPWLLIWLFWQKFVYRQLMYLVILRSLLSAAKGSSVGWGKFGRTGTVPVQGRVVGS